MPFNGLFLRQKLVITRLLGYEDLRFPIDVDYCKEFALFTVQKNRFNSEMNSSLYISTKRSMKKHENIPTIFSSFIGASKDIVSHCIYSLFEDVSMAWTIRYAMRTLKPITILFIYTEPHFIAYQKEDKLSIWCRTRTIALSFITIIVKYCILYP